jgi:hypothetical protein
VWCAQFVGGIGDKAPLAFASGANWCEGFASNKVGTYGDDDECTKVE